MHVSDDEKTILAPAMRRACALMLHWGPRRDIEGVLCVFSEMTTLSDATDTILAILLLQEHSPLSIPESTLHGIARCAALKERWPSDPS